MKSLNFFIIVLILLCLTACSSSQYYLKQGNYDASIHAAVKKLLRKPTAQKDIKALEMAYNAEKNAIFNSIEQLRLEGQPSSWVSIFKLYDRLDMYQKKVQPLLPLFLKKEFRNANIPITKINQELAETKMKASNFLFANGVKLMEQNNKNAAREAYYNFRQVKELTPDFENIDHRLSEAYNVGQNHILIRYYNESHLIMPQAFMANLMLYDERILNSEWAKFTKEERDSVQFNYFVDVIIQNIQISPEQLRESQYTDTKEVEDGFRYVLDNSGNVKKDSNGNDVKEQKYKTISAVVTQTSQRKAGSLLGTVIYANAKGSPIKSFPFREDLMFQNNFAGFQGSREALSAESLKKIGGIFLPFPSDIQLVMDASEIIKSKTLHLIRVNTGMVSQ